MTATAVESQAVEEVFERIASDLSMLADREIEVREVTTERVDHRPAGEGRIHVSFRFGVVHGDGEDVAHGTFLLPLPEAVALAGFLMMLPDAEVESQRGCTELDDAVKDAILEVGNFVSGAVDAALRATGAQHRKVRFEGCQGVRADVRPRLHYEEGAPLVVGRAKIAVGGFEAADALLMLPPGEHLG